MNHNLARRHFLAASAGALTLAAGYSFADDKKDPPFKISLAEWSLHKSIFGKKIDHLDFAKIANKEFGLDGVEYVNQFFKDKAKDEKYLGEMKTRASDLGVKSLLIMIDGEGALGDPDDAKRTTAVENHYKWCEAAKFLGCHSIRVNAQTDNNKYEEGMKWAADGLRRLSEFAAQHKLNVIVENHGGLSSNGKWLAATIKSVGLENCGTLPDFGNFGSYDRYMGVEETMPYAKAVSAKSHDFDAEGNETKTDYIKMMKIVLAHKYHGYVGIEYEGSKLEEMEGIRATLKLLQKCQKELA
jgi:sugar phosphate isomerase/epimerase